MLLVAKTRGGVSWEREPPEEQSPNPGQNSQQAFKEPPGPMRVTGHHISSGSLRVRWKTLRERRGMRQGSRCPQRCWENCLIERETRIKASPKVKYRVRCIPLSPPLE